MPVSVREILVDGSGCVDADECSLDPPPCLHGTCVDSRLGPTPDGDGGNITVLLGEYACICDSSWQGSRCDELAPPVSGVLIVGGVLLFVCCVCAVADQHAEWQDRRSRYARLQQGHGQSGGSGARRPNVPRAKGPTSSRQGPIKF